MRPLTEWELSQLQGMRAMTLDEMAKVQGWAARDMPEAEKAQRQLEANKGMQNHLWPW